MPKKSLVFFPFSYSGKNKLFENIHIFSFALLRVRRGKVSGPGAGDGFPGEQTGRQGRDFARRDLQPGEIRLFKRGSLGYAFFAN